MSERAVCGEAGKEEGLGGSVREGGRIRKQCEGRRMDWEAV